MKTRYFTIAILFALLTGCNSHSTNKTLAKVKINRMLNDWHNAAAASNFDMYFSHFASDSAIYMGTDAAERWVIPEFKRYAKPYFRKDEGWSFTPVQRHIYVAKSGQTAWFDEVLGTPNLGPARGTGVVVKQDTSWKIAHYNLSIPVPNAIADTVVKQIGHVLDDSIAQ